MVIYSTLLGIKPDFANFKQAFPVRVCVCVCVSVHVCVFVIRFGVVIKLCKLRE